MAPACEEFNLDTLEGIGKIGLPPLVTSLVSIF